MVAIDKIDTSIVTHVILASAQRISRFTKSGRFVFGDACGMRGRVVPCFTVLLGFESCLTKSQSGRSAGENEEALLATFQLF